MKKLNNILLEGVKIPIHMRNFAGKKGDYNPAGRRNFCVFLDILVPVDANYRGGQGVVTAPAIGPGFFTMVAYLMEDDGWNVKWLEPKEEGVDRIPYLPVEVRYENIPPKVVIISKRGKTLLAESDLHILDFAEIATADVLVNPYQWDVHGKSGVKAYAKSLYVTIAEDELESKYYNLPDAAIDAIGGCGNCDVCDGTCQIDED